MYMEPPETGHRLALLFPLLLLPVMGSFTWVPTGPGFGSASSKALGKSPSFFKPQFLL